MYGEWTKAPAGIVARIRTFVPFSTRFLREKRQNHSAWSVEIEGLQVTVIHELYIRQAAQRSLHPVTAAAVHR